MYDIFFVSKKTISDDDWLRFSQRFPRSQKIENVKTFNDINRRAFSKMFWVVWDDLVVSDHFKFDYIVPKWDQKYIHVFKNQDYYDGITLFPKSANLIQKEFENRFFINNKKEIDVCASVPKPYDIVFISYNELDADKNYNTLLERFPRAKRVHGVKGIHQAHIEAAKVASTEMFWVVDADALIVDEFNFSLEQIPYYSSNAKHMLTNTVHVWRSRNPINGLEYGYGGVKLFPRKLTLEMDVNSADMTTSISKLFKAMTAVSNITAFNTDSFSTWRSAFRECVKLSSKIINGQVDEETQIRLDVWCKLNQQAKFGMEAYKGALAGVKYGTENKDNVDALKKINDFEWLEKEFNMIDTMKKDTICAVPWMHLAFEPNGKVIPCCLTSPHNYFVGDLKTQTIDEIWNGQMMKDLRKQMINGEEPKICSTCFDKEKVTAESSRYYHSKEFKKVIDIIPEITLEDGTCTTMELKYWDFRFSNLCNYKCRSCGPRYSSAWVQDSKKMGWSEQEKVWNIEGVNDSTNYDFLKNQVQHVQKIYFAGGEPLLMPEHWQTLDMLVEHKRFDVKLSYNTNASTLTYGKKNVLDYWKQWDNYKIEVWPSLDEIGPRAELIRSGTVWPKVEENIKAIAALENVTVRPGMTMGAWNIFRFPEIIQHLIDIGIVTEKQRYSNFFINVLQYPAYYHVSILPDDFRKEIIDKLERFIAEHNSKYNTDISNIMSHIMHELQKPFEEKNARAFIDITEKLDAVRGENTFETIPEMQRVRDEIHR